MRRHLAKGHAAADGGDPSGRLRALPLPFVALLVVLGLTAYSAYDRDANLALEQTQHNEAAQTEFTLELQSARQHVQSEVDRLTELTRGMAAFTEASTDLPGTAVAEYMELTGASERFAGLIEAVFIPTSGSERPDPAAVAAALAARDRLTETPNGVLTTPSPEVLAALGRAAQGSPFLITATLEGTEITSLNTPLTNATGSAGFASLLFESDSFLARAMAPNGRLTTELVNTGERIDDGTEPYDPERAVLVALTASNRLKADSDIDVFRTRFQIRIVSNPGFVQQTSRAQVWVILISGAVGAFAIYAALRQLRQSNSKALESARQANRQRAHLDQRVRASFEMAPIGMAEVDSAGLLVEANPALCAQAGKERDAIIGRPLSMLVFEGDRAAHVERVESLLNGSRDSVQGQHRFRHPDGGDVWVHESISALIDETGGQRSLLVQSQDITAQRQAAWELAQQALHDDLTKLPNRALLMNRLKHALVRSERGDRRVAVMFIDIDRFKTINDSLGHDVGDEFLVQIADRLSTAIRAGDTVARFGGDEFVVLCDSVASESEAAATAQRLQSVFTEPFSLGKTTTYATASIGITLSSDGESSADALLRDADAAMYRAKDAGRNRTEVFDNSMRSSILARMEIESQLRKALDNGEIVMHYQAIVDPLTHLPVGYEALIRWNHPEKGLLGPGAFLPVAEEAGLIHLIDSFALRSSCLQIAEWLADYPAARNLYVATNWSARHLGRFVQQVEQILVETGIDPRHLVIEVTEGFLLEDSDASLLALKRLKQLGVQIAIDDFGTGYSSLSYLTKFAVDFLKIDQSFVSKLPDDSASAAIIGAIADLATRLGIKLVAEGVETDAQIAMLATLGAPRLQGYRFAKPRPAADIAQQLALRSGSAEGILDDPDALSSPIPLAAASPAP